MQSQVEINLIRYDFTGRCTPSVINSGTRSNSKFWVSEKQHKRLMEIFSHQVILYSTLLISPIFKTTFVRRLKFWKQGRMDILRFLRSQSGESNMSSVRIFLRGEVMIILQFL